MITSENSQTNLSRRQEKKLKLEEIGDCIRTVEDWTPQQQKDYFEQYCREIGAQGKKIPKEIEDIGTIIETFQTKRWQRLCGLPDIGEYAIMAGTAIYCRKNY